MRKAFFILCFGLILGVEGFAQHHPVVASLSEALLQNKYDRFAPMLGEELVFKMGTTNQTAPSKEVLSSLQKFVKSWHPQQVQVRHQGESANGQIYAMGQLESREGKHYAWMLRARAEANSYQIVQLELSPQ